MLCIRRLCTFWLTKFLLFHLIFLTVESVAWGCRLWRPPAGEHPQSCVRCRCGPPQAGPTAAHHSLYSACTTTQQLIFLDIRNLVWDAGVVHLGQVQQQHTALYTAPATATQQLNFLGIRNLVWDAGVVHLRQVQQQHTTLYTAPAQQLNSWFVDLKKII